MWSRIISFTKFSFIWLSVLYPLYGYSDLKKILIVDDSNTPRNSFKMQMRRILRGKRISVLDVESGPQALETLEKEKNIILIFMDQQMPFMLGSQVVAIIRSHSNELIRNIPIVAHSSDENGENQQLIDAGANYFLKKSTSFETLVGFFDDFFKQFPEIEPSNQDPAPAEQGS